MKDKNKHVSCIQFYITCFPQNDCNQILKTKVNEEMGQYTTFLLFVRREQGQEDWRVYTSEINYSNFCDFAKHYDKEFFQCWVSQNEELHHSPLPQYRQVRIPNQATAARSVPDVKKKLKKTTFTKGTIIIDNVK